MQITHVRKNTVTPTQLPNRPQRHSPRDAGCFEGGWWISRWQWQVLASRTIWFSNFKLYVPRATGYTIPGTNITPEKRWLEDFSGAMLVLERVAAVIDSHVSSLIRSLFLGHSYCHSQFPSHATKNGWLIAFMDAVSFDTEPA